MHNSQDRGGLCSRPMDSQWLVVIVLVYPCLDVLCHKLRGWPFHFEKCAWQLDQAGKGIHIKAFAWMVEPNVSHTHFAWMVDE